jgi:hypothetical protein
MEELYVQQFGKKRIVLVTGWNKSDARVEDISTGLVYAINWDLFFKCHEKLGAFKCNVEEYSGANLSI